MKRTVLLIFSILSVLSLPLTVDARQVNVGSLYRRIGVYVVPHLKDIGGGSTFSLPYCVYSTSFKPSSYSTPTRKANASRRGAVVVIISMIFVVILGVMIIVFPLVARNRENTNKRDNFGNIIPRSGSEADKAYFLAVVQGLTFSYLLGDVAPRDFVFIERANLNRESREINDLWDKTLDEVNFYSPHDFTEHYNTGEQTFLVCYTFPCWYEWYYQYRTSGQAITIADVVDVMFEIMDVKPRSRRYVDCDGRSCCRFAWMFLRSDLDRLSAMFAQKQYAPGWDTSMDETFRDMYTQLDRLLKDLARRVRFIYPFMEWELDV